VNDPKEARYQMVLRRLQDLANVQEELQQRQEELCVQIGDEARARVELAERVAAVERAAGLPCCCGRQMEDVQRTVHDHGQELDELLTAIDKVGTACGLDLFPDTIPERVPVTTPPAAPPEASSSSSSEEKQEATP